MRWASYGTGTVVEAAGDARLVMVGWRCVEMVMATLCRQLGRVEQEVQNVFFGGEQEWAKSRVEVFVEEIARPDLDGRIWQAQRSRGPSLIAAAGSRSRVGSDSCQVRCLRRSPLAFVI